MKTISLIRRNMQGFVPWKAALYYTWFALFYRQENCFKCGWFKPQQLSIWEKEILCADFQKYWTFELDLCKYFFLFSAEKWWGWLEALVGEIAHKLYQPAAKEYQIVSTQCCTKTIYAQKVFFVCSRKFLNWVNFSSIIIALLVSLCVFQFLQSSIYPFS